MRSALTLLLQTPHLYEYVCSGKGNGVAIETLDNKSSANCPKSVRSAPRNNGKQRCFALATQGGLVPFESEEWFSP